MHVKQVIVCGFRSYKDQVATEPFSHEHNVVIGRNGTGKSNFFDAIRFCLLTSRFANLRPEERQALLHEGAGKHVLSAYVEIVFANHDGRLPIDTEDVVLRRTIGVKKDEFFLNRKHITKSDVIHLLESAGFSRSNPYYIVEQGKVNALAVMKEHERLNLLKEVAGTNVYEERRIESLKIMQETQNRRTKIEEVIAYIEARLAELEEEKDELKEYQKLDREQRALLYAMHENELQHVRTELEVIERKRVQGTATATELHDRQTSIQQEMARIEASQVLKNEDLARAMEERKIIENERKENMEQRYKLELEVRELEEKLGVDAAKKTSMQQEMTQVERSIDAKQRELHETILPAYKQAQQALDDLQTRLHERTRQSDNLIAKQSRKTQFKTQKERDNYLRSQIKELEGLVRRKKSDATALGQSVADLTRSIEDSQRAHQECIDRLDAQTNFVNSARAELLTLVEQRNALSEERKDKWRLENQITHDMRKLTDDLSRGESILNSTMPYDIRRGLGAVEEMSQQGRVRGIFGSLIDNMRPVDERYCAALDEAAGNSLFHVVVDTDDTAAKIMRELERKNLGRLTFLPLNRLKVNDATNYPRNDDVFPLIDKLEYPREIHKAVLTAVGKKLLCRDLATCIQYAEQTNMDCLTKEGDMVHRRGAVNGGYRDPRRSRTRAMMDIRRTKRELDSVREQAERASFEARQADQRVSSIVGEVQKKEAEKQHAISVYEQLCNELTHTKTQIESDGANRNRQQRMLETQERDIQNLNESMELFRAELATAMQDELSSQEIESLQLLAAELTELQNQVQGQQATVDRLATSKEGAETVLSENLVRRRDELTQQLRGNLEELEAREQEEALKAKRLNLESASRLAKDSSTLLESVDDRTLALQEELASDKVSRDALQNELTVVNERLEQDTRQAETLLNRRRQYLQRRDKVTKDIRDLGSLPMSEVLQFRSLSHRDVLRTYNDRTEKLQQYRHVNKKALDQYVSFSEQRTALLDRKQELDQGDQAIKDLIEVLDRRKDEAILRTFKGVSHHFSEVFKELVPTGNGKMLIIRADQSSSREEDGSATVDTFAGVQIKVTFRGEGDSYLMQQLSGGQKALVALAFIFAIQRCDPAPFYLFDEIDQALDSTHRAAVAALIHHQAHSKENPAQFITSTFRPELVTVGDKFYGIGYQNKISNVYTMTKQESLDFIANIVVDEEDVEVEQSST